MPRVSRSCMKQGGILSRGFGGSTALLNNLVVGLQNYERIFSIVLSHPVCDILSWQLQKPHTARKEAVKAEGVFSRSWETEASVPGELKETACNMPRVPPAQGKEPACLSSSFHRSLPEGCSWGTDS